MPSHLFVGGAHDGLNITVEDGQRKAQIPVGATGSEVYIRDTLAVGVYKSFTFYRHEELTPAEVLDLLVKHYQAWAADRTGGHR